MNFFPSISVEEISFVLAGKQYEASFHISNMNRMKGIVLSSDRLLTFGISAFRDRMHCYI